MMRIYIYITLLFITFVGKGQLVFDTTLLQKVNIINEKEINSEHLEFCPIFYNDYILFVKSNKESGFDDNMDDYFLDLSYAAKNGKGNLSKHAFLPPSINTEMHEGQAAWDDVNNKLYFTRSFYNKEKGSRRDTIVLKIYEASKSNNFEVAKSININNDRYNTCHPTLNRNGDVMIFSSNMPGSQAMDLYSVKKVGNLWSDPIALSNINTAANEVFPSLFKDSILVFSGNYEKNAGGYDLYYSMLSDTGWSKPNTFPYPINSSFDEIGFTMNAQANQIYFSSNRPGGKGKDDIYRVETKNSFLKKTVVEINASCIISVLDKLNFSPIKNGKISISNFDLNKDISHSEIVKGQSSDEFIMKINTNGKILYQLTTDENGKASSILENGKSYVIKFIANGYDEQIMIYTPQNDGSDLTIVANPKEEEKTIPKKEEKMIIPTKIGAVVVFENIYYEYGSAIIKADAASELDLLFSTMLQNPSMRIQLSAHTDARGNSLYNKQLSAQRAQSAKNYLTTKGIEESRIKCLGFGESRIRNQCVDGVTCSEEDHLFNRRTEVLVIE